jgi:hypothetical protein
VGRERGVDELGLWSVIAAKPEILACGVVVTSRGGTGCSKLDAAVTYVFRGLFSLSRRSPSKQYIIVLGTTFVIIMKHLL